MIIKKLLILHSTFLLLSLISAPAAYSQDDVHFGTIFVEDVEYEQSENNQGINHLTDQSQKQLQLETLYKNDIGKTNEQLKKVEMQRTPASTTNPEHDSSEKVGVVRNDELPQKIVYFLELRSFQGNNPAPVYPQSNQAAAPLLQLQPGEMIKVVDTPSQYIHKMRMDRDNQGLWKTITTRPEDSKSLNLYYDWRNFDTITSHELPIELDVLVPFGKNSIPTFSRPGSWTWKDCSLAESICIDNIDLHTKAYLFDSTIVNVSQSQTLAQTYKVFYKIGYSLKDKDGKLQHKVGWIPAEHAKRKITQLPKSLLATRTPDSFGTFESDEERRLRLQKYYVFNSNMNSDNKNVNRWISSTPGSSTEVFNKSTAIDGFAGFSTFHLEQSFLNEEFDQQGANVGLGMFVPLFVDLEGQAIVTGTIPISANESATFEKAYLLKAEQWLIYTTPISINGSPFKFGVGGYYMSMFASEKQFGFNSLVGFQGKVLYETESTWFSMRYGPTGQDLNFRFENRDIGGEIGFRFDPSRKYESWSIYGDFSDTSFNNPKSGNSTKYQILQLGIRKQF